MPVARAKSLINLQPDNELFAQDANMEPWPFDTIAPEQLDALTAEEREGLEAITAAFITAVLRNRGVEPPPTSAD